jgi:hypothetical protein
MGAQSRGVGRPAKNTRRVELRLNADDPMTKALETEAAARHVTLQEHITDILKARFLNQPIQQQAPEQQTEQSSAAALADEFM